MRHYTQGKFSPNNRAKYHGDPSKIFYRSGLELSAMAYFDRHTDIIEWSSETKIVPYISPKDGRMHRYFVDFTVRIRDKNKEIKSYIIEVKPYSKLQPPKKRSSKTGKPTVYYLREATEYAVNTAKFEAADKYAQTHGMEFIILTEREILGKKILNGY